MSGGDFDVAVIGAGPSGAWTACLLARRGARVLLVDPSHPREKPCGGGVTGRALSIVVDAFAARELPAVRISAARFTNTAAGDSALVGLDLAEPGGALIVASRRDFDGLLLGAARRAGAELLVDRVTDITRGRAGFRINTAGAGARMARCVVGADGANSLVRRRLARSLRRDQLSIATGFFAHGVSSEEIVIELMTDPPGYIWSFPRPDHLAIGICAPCDAGVTSGALRARTADWIHATGIARGARLEPYAWPIPSLSARDFEALDVAGPGWLLVGDAAGLVDPITREGISFALQSAAHAADAIASGSPAGHRCYTDRLRAQIGSELSRAARFKAGFFRPHFTRLMVDALGRSQPIRRVMADLVTGTQSYRNLKWRLAKTMELGFAWRSLAATARDTRSARARERSQR
jgi:geranylgeranyl reductase family protein